MQWVFFLFLQYNAMNTLTILPSHHDMFNDHFQCCFSIFILLFLMWNIFNYIEKYVNANFCFLSKNKLLISVLCHAVKLGICFPNPYSKINWWLGVCRGEVWETVYFFTYLFQEDLYLWKRSLCNGKTLMNLMLNLKSSKLQAGNYERPAW